MVRFGKRLRVAASTAAAMAAAAFQATPAIAVDGTWNPDAGGNWSLGTNWVSSTIADGTDGTANFVRNITATRTVTVDTPRTIGNLVFTDATTASNDWVLAGTAANPLTLDVTTGTPTINVTNRTATVSAILAGNDGLARGLGSGVLVLSGANTYSGATSIGAGITYIGASSSVTGGVVTAGPVGVGTLTLSGGTFGDNGTARTLQNNLIVSGNVTLASSGTASLTFNSTGLTTPASITITGTPTLTVTNTTTFANAITAASAFTKAGSGTLVLSGDNSAATGVSVTGGIVRFASAAAIPAASGQTVTAAAGGTASFSFAVDNATLGRIAPASAGVIALNAASSNNLDFSSLASARLGADGAFTYSGTLTPNGTTYRLGGGGGTLTVSSALAVAGTTLDVGLGGTAGGTVVLSNAANAFSSVAINGGTLQVSGDGAAGAATSPLGAVPATPTANLTLAGGGLLRLGAAFTPNVNRSITLGTGGGGFDTNGNALTLANAVTGTGGFIKAGVGTLTLNTTLPGNAPLTITAGTLDFANANYTASSLTMGGGASGTASVLELGTGTLTLGGNLTYSATNNPNGATINAASINLGSTVRTLTIGDSTAATNDLTINAAMTGTGTAGFTKSAANSNLVLAATNTYPGLTQINGGTLTLAAPGGNAIPGNLTTVPGVASSTITIAYAASNQIADTATVTLGGVSGQGGTALNLGTFNDTIGSLVFNNNQGSGNVNATTTTGTLTVAGPITYGGSSTGINTISGNLSLGGAMRTITVNPTGSGAQSVLSAAVSDGGITKAGAALLQMTNAANTYAGGTIIAAGTLKTGAGVTTTPDAGTGVLGLGDVTVNAVLSGTAAQLTLDNRNAIDDAAALRLDAGTTAAFNGKAFLNFSGNEIVAALYLGGVLQPEGIYNATTNPDYFVAGGTGNIQVVIPEPASMGLIALAATGLLARRRRVRRRSGDARI
jgi:autotransporter-associated beta strand protein